MLVAYISLKDWVQSFPDPSKADRALIVWKIAGIYTSGIDICNATLKGKIAETWKREGHGDYTLQQVTEELLSIGERLIQNKLLKQEGTYYKAISLEIITGSF